jgi:hypothetical protein
VGSEKDRNLTECQASAIKNATNKMSLTFAADLSSIHWTHFLFSSGFVCFSRTGNGGRERHNQPKSQIASNQKEELRTTHNKHLQSPMIERGQRMSRE